jgi:cytochrome c oxidase subunit 1
MILGTPVIAITVLMVAAERALHLGIFDPALGGDPVLFQHLFWFYSHPAVYIMILPAMGVISEIVQAFSRKNIFGYSFIAFSSLAIAIIGFFVWGHHLFVAGQSTYAGLVFSILSFLVAIPSAIKVFNWTATIYRARSASSRRCSTPSGSSASSRLAASRALPRRDGARHPHARHVLRRRALPLHHGRRRHHGLPRRAALLVAEDQRQALFRAVGEVLRAAGVRRLQPDVLPAVRRRVSRDAAALPRVSAGVPGAERALDGRRVDPRGGLPAPDHLLHPFGDCRKKAPADPWGARGLEWEIPSPPPTENFTVTPVVTELTHQYGQSQEVGIA